MTNINKTILKIRDELIEKRKQQIIASGYQSTLNSNHMCAILDFCGNPLIYGTNIFNVRKPTTEHAEAQALRKLFDKYSYENQRRKMNVDIIVVRTNGSNSKPCDRCIREMERSTYRLRIRHVYYTHQDEDDGIRCVKFGKLVEDQDRHYSSYDRNIRRRHLLQDPPNLQVSRNSNAKYCNIKCF